MMRISIEHLRLDALEHNCREPLNSHNVGPPSYVWWFINPINTIVISTINHRIQPLIRQLNAIERGPHIAWILVRYLCIINHSEIGVVICTHACTNWTRAGHGLLVAHLRSHRRGDAAAVRRAAAGSGNGDASTAHGAASRLWHLGRCHSGVLTYNRCVSSMKNE